MYVTGSVVVDWENVTMIETECTMYGGSVLVYSSTGTLSRCLFLRTNASQFGGTVMLLSASSITIVDSTFTECTADSGACLCCNTDCGFSLIGLTALNTFAETDGGFMFLYGYATMTNCVLRNCRSIGYFGGVLCTFRVATGRHRLSSETAFVVGKKKS